MKYLIAITLLTLPFLASAHVGHSHIPAEEPAHYLTAGHVIPWLLVALAVIGFTLYRRNKQRHA